MAGTGAPPPTWGRAQRDPSCCAIPHPAPPTLHPQYPAPPSTLHTAPHPTFQAIWLREGLVRLGPTFIKIGQQFSTRVDVLAPEFIKELEKLQVGGEEEQGKRGGGGGGVCCGGGGGG